MKHLCLLIFCFISSLSFAQEILKNQKSISLYTRYFATARGQFEGFFTNDLIDISSRPLMGVEAELRGQQKLKDKFELGIGFKFGMYPVDYGIFIDNDFPLVGYDRGLDVFIVNYEPTYIGLNLASKYFFYEKKKSLFSLEFNLGLNYFFREGAGLRIIGVGDMGINVRVFEALTIVNDNSNMIMSGGLTLGYNLKLSQRVMMNFSLAGTYSNSDPLRGTYTIRGIDETLFGSHRKQFAFAGLEIGVTYFLRERVVIIE